MYQYIESLYRLPGVAKVYNPFVGPASFAECSMGSWGPNVWIDCDHCGWGAWGGKDHIHIDGWELTVLCQWCFETPDPPFWTTRQKTAHFLMNMRVLPEPLLRDGLVPELVGEFLFQLYDDVD